MRKFLRFFFLCLLIASLVTWVYFSYVSAPKGEAILIERLYDSSTGIAKDNIILPGKAKFIIRRILPNQIRIHPVRLSPHSTVLNFRRGLEQSEILGLDDTFYIKINLYLFYRLETEKLSFLFQRLSKLNWDALPSYIDLRLQNFMEKKLDTLYENDDDLPKLKRKLKNYIENTIQAELNQEFKNDGIVFINSIPRKIYVPHPLRYKTMLASASEILKQKLERIRIVDIAKAQKDASTIKNQSYISRLEKIGKLLGNYPQLREYLAIDSLGENVEVLVMPYDRWFSQSPLSLSSKNSLTNKKRNPRNKNNIQIPAPAPIDIPYARESQKKGQFSDLSPP